MGITTIDRRDACPTISGFYESNLYYLSAIRAYVIRLYIFLFLFLLDTQYYILDTVFLYASHYTLFKNYKYSRGSVITPFIAEAATVAGEDKNIFAFVLPILPGKFLLEVDMQASPEDRTPSCAPRQGPQEGVTKAAPAFNKV